MIKGTNAYCKLKDIVVNETTATITLLIFATKSTIPAKAFRICIKDEDTEEINYVDNNTYWIDQVNNYSFDTNNVDTKKHKEIMFNVDISRANTSDIKGNRWIRNCSIYLIDASKTINDLPAWSSGVINLISDDFEIPTIQDISFSTVDVTGNTAKIKTEFSLAYSSEKDFNYNNNNFSALMNVRSIATDSILESKQIAISSIGLKNEIETDNYYTLRNHIVIQLVITNKNGEVVRDERKIYLPTKKYSQTFVKTKTGIKRVITVFAYVDSLKEHEGEWL